MGVGDRMSNALFIDNRRKKVLQFIGLNFSESEIADKLDVSISTIKNDIKFIREKNKSTLFNEPIEQTLFELGSKIEVMENRLHSLIIDDRNPSNIRLGAINSWRDTLKMKYDILIRLGILHEAPKGFFEVGKEDDDIQRLLKRVSEREKDDMEKSKT